MRASPQVRKQLGHNLKSSLQYVYRWVTLDDPYYPTQGYGLRCAHRRETALLLTPSQDLTLALSLTFRLELISSVGRCVQLMRQKMVKSSMRSGRKSIAVLACIWILPTS